MSEGFKRMAGSDTMDSMVDLHQLALRMAREMPLKERIIHLQAFKHTFHGQQAVAYLTSAGISADVPAAVATCQQLLEHGLFRGIHNKEFFTPDNEVYRFPRSLLENNRQKGLTSLTSTGLYKEIARFGKAAAQPFKDIQTSLNDTFATLGNLSAVAPKLVPSTTTISNSLGVRSHSSRVLRAVRRTQSAKLGGQVSGSRSQAEQDVVTTLAGELQALHTAVKESTSLIKLDLQQQTALQEHMVGLLQAQQVHNQSVRMLGSIIAASASLLVTATGDSWPFMLLGCLMLVMVVLVMLRSCLSVGLHQLTAAWHNRQHKATEEGGFGSQLMQQASIAPSLTGHAASYVSADDTDSCGILSGDDLSDLESVWLEGGPCLEDFDCWPDQPVMLCPDPSVTQQVFQAESRGPCRALPVNSVPIPFESDMFSGVLVVYIRHLATTPSHLFKGKKRLNWIALQGQFKRPVCMDSLVFGQEFRHKLCNLPAPWFIDNMLLPLARKISPALRVGSLEQPYFYSPLITASQIVNVALPGSAPNIMDVQEDTTLVGPALGCKPGEVWTVAGRRKYFQSAAQRQACQFTTDHVWTFHLWQEYVDFASYMLNLSYSSYDLAQHLDGQPLQVMVKDVSCGGYLLNLHVWHRNLVRSQQLIFNHQLARPPRSSAQESFTETSTQPAAADAANCQPCSPRTAPVPQNAAGNETSGKVTSPTAASAQTNDLQPQKQQAGASRGVASPTAAGSHTSVLASTSAGSAAAASGASSEHLEQWYDAVHNSSKNSADRGIGKMEQARVSSDGAATSLVPRGSLDTSQQGARIPQPAADVAVASSTNSGSRPQQGEMSNGLEVDTGQAGTAAAPQQQQSTAPSSSRIRSF